MSTSNTQPTETDTQRFSRTMRALFRVPKAELEEQLAKSDAEEPVRTSGAKKGTPNWRTKRKQQINEEPTR